jgi:hypothetical protein
LKELSPQVVDPSNHFQALIQAVSAATHIPKRILIGSERGELASSQDDINWGQHIDYRQHDHCEIQILRPFIDKMILIGELPEPSDPYTIEWPEVIIPTEKDRAEVDRTKIDTLNKYVSGLGADQVVPPEMFLRKFMKFTDDEILQAKDMLGGMIEIEREEVVGDRSEEIAKRDYEDERLDREAKIK